MPVSQSISTMIGLPTPEGVRHVGDSARDEAFAVGGELQGVRSAVVGHECGVVLDEAGDGEVAHPLAGVDLPVNELRGQVAGRKLLAIGMEGDVIDMPFVADQFAHQGAVGEVPELDLQVIAARGEQLSIGTDRDRPQPTLMSLDGANGGRLFGGGGPPNQPAVVAAAHQRFAVGREDQAVDPTVVRGEFGLSSRRQFPANELVVFATSEHVTSRGIESATDQRRGVGEGLGHMSLGGIGGHHGFLAERGGWIDHVDDVIRDRLLRRHHL